MQPKKQENRGGARANSGPKALGVPECEKASLVQAVKKMSKALGKTPGDIVAELLFEPDLKPTNRIAILKLYYDIVAPPAKAEVNIQNNTGPTIGLPETKVVEPARKPEELN